MPKTNDFLRQFFLDFWKVWASPDLRVGPLFGSKNQFVSLFFRYYNFLSIFERFEDVLEGFGEDLGRVWEGLGKVWGGFGEAFGLILDSKMMFGDQSGAGMFKKCLGTFVWSFELLFLDVWGGCSKATGQNEGGPADCALRSAAHQRWCMACWIRTHTSCHTSCLTSLISSMLPISPTS